MKHISKFKNFNNKPVSVIKEGLWSRIFGDASTKDTSDTRGQKDDKNYIMFQGQKFYDADIEYDDYNSTKAIPRVERGKLIIANPAWSE